MLKALLNAVLGTHEPKPRTIQLIPERRDYMSPPPARTFLVKTKPLDPITAMVLIEGVTGHMVRCANQLITHKVAHPQGTDPKFHELATNLLRLSNEIETFLRKKGDIAGEKPYKPIDRLP